MHIAFVTDAVIPFSTGESSDIAHSLPKSLRDLEHEVTVFAPFPKDLNPAVHSLGRRLSTIDIEYEGTTYPCVHWNGRTVAGVSLVFLQNEAFENGSLPVVFGEAMMNVISAMGDIEVLHGFGHFGTQAMSAAQGSSLRRFVTINHDSLTSLELEVCKSADEVTTLTMATAATLSDSLGRSVISIGNGVDHTLWNPLTDSALPARFDPVDQAGKAHCKSTVQHQFSLPIRPEVCLSAVVLETEEERDALIKAGPTLLRNDVQLIAIDRIGDDEPHPGLLDLQSRWEERFQTRAEQDLDVTHRVLGAADILLEPSMAPEHHAYYLGGHRYGALPVVRRTSHVEEAVVDCDAALATGTGFLFGDDDEIVATFQRAVGAFQLREAFYRLRSRAMLCDHSWDRSARLYNAAYRRHAETA